MKAHSFIVSQPRLRSRRAENQGAAVPQFEISINEVHETEAPAVLTVTYGPYEDGDTVTLRRHGGRLFAEFDGRDYWSHGPRPCAGASPEGVQEMVARGVSSGLLSALSLERLQYRNRRGSIIGDDRPGEMAAKAKAFLFVDGRLHRAVNEPVWEVSYQGYEDPALVRARISLRANETLHPSLTVRFDRPDVADALLRLQHGRRRNCRFGERMGSVTLIDQSYEPSFDVIMAMAEAYGENVLRKIEPELPSLDHGCAVAFATMAEGVAMLEQQGHAAALQFCDGFYDLHVRLSADRRSVPADLNHWLKEKTVALLHRIEIARAHEAAAPAPQP